MIQVKKEGVLLEKTTHGFENEAVSNPAAIRVGDHVHLFYRAVSMGNYSSIGYCRLRGPMTIEERHDLPLLFPQHDYETHGIEDPRIVLIDDLYYLTYTAYDGVNALGALATSRDLQHFEKHGVIVPQMSFQAFKHLAESRTPLNEKYTRYNDRSFFTPTPGKEMLLWDKNVIFFPRRINGLLYFMHRIRPDIQIAAVEDIQGLTRQYWEDYLLHMDEKIAMTPGYEHEVSYIGGGCPPIETTEGWLLIYHGVHDTPRGYVYTVGAALMDLDNPWREIARLPYPLFQPEYKWELIGEVNNVCFPTGAVLFGDTLYIYYGAADECIACASVSLTELVAELSTYTSYTSNEK